MKGIRHQRVDGKQATLVVTPAANSSGTITVSVAAGKFSDLAGNINATATNGTPVAYDTVVKTQMALPVTFDSPTVDYGFVGFGGAEDSSLVVDPTNAANKVAKVVRAAGSEVYAGTTVTAAAGLGFSPKIPFNVTDTRMSVRVWSPDAGIPVRLKVEDHANPGKSVETETLVTTAAAWQTLSFNFAPGSQVAGTPAIDFANTYDKATIFFDFGRAKPTSVQKTYYFDDMAFVPGAGGGGGGACGTTAPTCAPTTVIPAGSTTIYSDAGNTAGFLPNPDWGQSPPVAYSEVTIASNKSLKYVFSGTALYEGLDWAANPVYVSSKGKLHLDFFSPDITSVKVSIISAGKENAVTRAVTAGSWNSVDIDLALYTVPDKTAIIQIKLEPSTAGTLYVDNIYFWGTAASGGGGGCTEMGCAGPVTIAVAPANDASGSILAGEAVFAGDYIGPVDSLGNHALWTGATTTGLASGGAIGYFNDTLLGTSGQKVEEGGWVSGSIDQPGVPNFFRYFVLTPPGSTFSSSYMGLFVNAPQNGTVNVSSYASIKMKLWGPAGMYEKPTPNPVLEVVLAGPKVAGCTATGSGGTEISKNLTANLKIGAASSYKLALTGWTVKGVCGTDTNATAAASVLAKLARVVVSVPATSFNFTNANSGTPVTYSTGVNLGPIGFTNN